MIANDTEATIAAYLTTESTAASGGLYLFKTQSGAGAALSIRTGHDDAGDLPDAGCIVVAVQDEDVRQSVPGLNLYQVPAKVTLYYPADNHTADATTLPSFEACITELDIALQLPTLTTELSNQGLGIIAAGFTDGMTFSTRIQARHREAEWTIPLAVNQTDRF